MTNSTSSSASVQPAQRSNISFATLICLIGLFVFITLALVAAISWNSPIGFFSFLAAAFLCVDPLRNSLR